MKRRGIRYVIPIIFIAVLVGAMVTYVLLHKNTEAEKGLDYASLIGVTGDSDFQNYWDTDGWYDLAAVEDGYYYMVTSADGGIVVMKNDILTDWRNPVNKQKVFEMPQGNANLWAPEIHYIDGHQYFQLRK